MTKEEFQNLYKNYIKNHTVNEDIRKVKERWEQYNEGIINEKLPLYKKENDEISWAKSREKDGEYLTNFIENKSLQFGKPGQGSSMQYMIYKCSAADKKDSWYDKYQDKNGKGGYIEDCKTVEDDYKKHILPLLKAILDAKTIDGLAKIENGSAEKENIVKLYKDFIDKQFLRKLAVLHFALDEDVSDKNSLLWIYDDDVVNNLVEIFESGVEETATYFEKSKAVWTKAVEWFKETKENSWENGCSSTITTSNYAQFAKLYNLLWELGKNNAGELMNFDVPNVIYHGAPGTGKTYTTLQTVKLLCQGDNSRYKYCQFHPSYSYQDFIEGIKPMGITTGGNVKLEVVNGIFKQFCIYVKKKNEDDYERYGINYDKYPHYYFIVDEINRGDLSRIFGETFSLLEPDYRDRDFSGSYNETENLIVTPLSNVIEKTSSKEGLAYKIIGGKVYFGIPFNIHFIGLMNDVDKSIDTFDLALRRRFKWITKKCDYGVIQDSLLDKISNKDEVADYKNSCEALNEFITKPEGLGLSENYQLGQSYFMKITNVVKNKINIDAKKAVFENYIETTLREYAREVCDENAIDDKINGAKKAFGIDIEKTTNSDEE